MNTIQTMLVDSRSATIIFYHTTHHSSEIVAYRKETNSVTQFTALSSILAIIASAPGHSLVCSGDPAPVGAKNDGYVAIAENRVRS